MKAVLLVVGHGAPPRDYPAEKVQKLKRLEAQRRREQRSMSAEEHMLDQEVRQWPRSATTDPYQAGMLKLAEALRAQTEHPVHVCYNEFCAPSLEDAIAELVGNGAAHICVLPTMFTPGGVHSEVEIPETLDAMHRLYPGVRFDYVWPFDLSRLAAMMLAEAAPHML